LGWNCRPTEYVAAVLLHRLQTFEAEQQRRAALFLTLRQQLAGIDCVAPLGVGPGVVRHSAYMFAMRYRPEHCGGLDMDDFVRAVQMEGIPVGRCYDTTVAQQPAFRRLAQKRPDYVRVFPTPVSDQAVKDLLYLPHPLFLGSDGDMAEIAAAFAKVQA